MFRRKQGLGFFFLGLAFCLTSGPLMAQNLPSGLSSSPDNPLAWNSFEISDLYQALAGLPTSRKYCVVAGRVRSIVGEVILGAVVEVNPLLPGEYRSFKTDASGDFQTVYFLKTDYSSDFKAWLTIKKKGFLTAHELIDYADFPKPTRLRVTLRPQHPDSGLLSQQDLLSNLLPRLESPGPSGGLSAKSEKKYAKGVLEFVARGRADRALSDFSEVARRSPECAKCQIMLALAELDSGNWDGAARHVDSAIALTTKNQNQTGGGPEALLLAGVMESWMHNHQSAMNFLLHADRLEPKNWLILQELGRAYLHLRRFELASACLERAVAAGAGPQARQLRVRALLGEDKLDAADAEMNRCLNGRAVDRMPLETRKVWAEVQERKQVRTLYAKPRPPKKQTPEAAALDYLHDSALQLHLEGLEPAKNQDELKNILAAAGESVAALFRVFQSSTSLETIRQKQLGRHGKVSSEIQEKCRYLYLMPDDPAIPGFTEYRQNVNPERGLPAGLTQGYMLTSGFASAALIFHPDYQSGSHFRCLGRQRMDGRETYVIAFAQIPMKAKLIGRFKNGEESVPTLEQGLAWIDTQNYRIVRLRRDLLKPLPEVRLRKVTTQIDYREVHFKRLAQGLWLPKDVTVTVDWHGKTLRNEHRYSDFQLFNVGTFEKIGKPKVPKELADSQSPYQ